MDPTVREPGQISLERRRRGGFVTSLLWGYDLDSVLAWAWKHQQLIQRLELRYDAGERATGVLRAAQECSWVFNQTAISLVDVTVHDEELDRMLDGGFPLVVDAANSQHLGELYSDGLSDVALKSVERGSIVVEPDPQGGKLHEEELRLTGTFNSYKGNQLSLDITKLSRAPNEVQKILGEMLRRYTDDKLASLYIHETNLESGLRLSNIIDPLKRVPLILTGEMEERLHVQTRLTWLAENG